jgi:threonyl-tRNA synthetase
MIRIRLAGEIHCVEKLYSNPAFRRIIFYDKDVKFEITLEDSQRFEELMTQACERGFIDFSKEKITTKVY